MIVACPTVQHSGTRFLWNLLSGFKKINATSEWNFPDLLIHEHFSQNDYPRLVGLLDTYEPPIIIPLRRLHSIVLSWERRQKGFDRLDIELERMTGLVDRQPYFLPVDAPDRDDWLQEINEGLNLNLSTDWSIVGSDKHSAGNPESAIRDQETYHRLKEKHDWFFSQVYRA